MLGEAWWSGGGGSPLQAEEGQGAGCGFHLSFHRINREQASNLGSKELGGFPGGSVVKNLPANVGDLSSIPGLGRSPAEGNGNLLQNCCLENPMDRGPGGLQSMGSWRVGHDWSAEQQESSQRRGTHTVPDSWHVNAVSTMNTSLAFFKYFKCSHS